MHPPSRGFGLCLPEFEFFMCHPWFITRLRRDVHVFYAANTLAQDDLSIHRRLPCLDLESWRVTRKRTISYCEASCLVFEGSPFQHFPYSLIFCVSVSHPHRDPRLSVKFRKHEGQTFDITRGSGIITNSFCFIWQ